MARDVKRIDIHEFRARGYLQEVNRLMLHPLGLALEVVVDDCDNCGGTGRELISVAHPERGHEDCGDCHDGKTERLGGVWDYRDDPEGILYGGDEIDREKIDAVAADLDAHRPAREGLLGPGSFIQTPGKG